MPRAQRFPRSHWHYTNYQTITKRKSWAIIPHWLDFFPLESLGVKSGRDEGKPMRPLLQVQYAVEDQFDPPPITDHVRELDELPASS